MNARKWNAKCRNWNISYILFSFSSIDRRKQRRRSETFAPCMGTMSSEIARICFPRFKEYHFDIRDSPRSGRPSRFDEDRLKTLIRIDPRQCTRELANMVNCDYSTIVRHFQSMGKVQKSVAWIQYALSQNHKNQRMAICASLFLVIDWLVNNIDHSYRYW